METQASIKRPLRRDSIITKDSDKSTTVKKPKNAVPEEDTAAITSYCIANRTNVTSNDLIEFLDELLGTKNKNVNQLINLYAKDYEDFLSLLKSVRTVINHKGLKNRITRITSINKVE